MKKVVIGGTFDLFHIGHEKIIEEGANHGKLFVGLTSNKMAQETKNRNVEDFEKRKKILGNFTLYKYKEKAEVRKIEDPFGFAVKEDFDFIIVSPETEKKAELINQEREKINKKPLNIVKISFVFAEDGAPISSTRISNKEIDRKGRLL